MCGIIAYLGTGRKDAADVLIAGLKRLEYRGYDSAGIALVEEGGDKGKGKGLTVIKKKGKVKVLESSYRGRPSSATTGIGHTRWATHGEPADRNSHPHTSACGTPPCEREIAVVREFVSFVFVCLKSGFGCGAPALERAVSSTRSSKENKISRRRQ